MKVRVRIEDRTYVVDIEDAQAAPVVAIVDGHRYELWPEDGPRQPETATASGASQQFSNEREVRAPIPGVILSVAVQPGKADTTGPER